MTKPWNSLAGIGGGTAVVLVAVYLAVTHHSDRTPVMADVPAATCAECHPAIARSYRLTGMGRSFYFPATSAATEDLSRSRYFHKPTATWYQMARRGGKLVQRRWETGPDGSETNVQELEVAYVMGSGNHVRTYLSRTTHRGRDVVLSELPLAWYSEHGGYWAMNPGYDTDHTISPRKISYECIFCHNAYPDVPLGHETEGSEPAYREPLPQGIDCQRCHGPGGEHVRLAREGKAGKEQVRQSIFNPARQGTARQMEVCLQCHLQATAYRLPSIVRRFNRAPFSYRAGEPLSAFQLYFDRAAPKADFEIVSAAYRLRQSRCFVSSGGALTCIRCHDPHEPSNTRAAIDRDNAVCAECHNSLATLISTGKHTRSADCVFCHMPKRRTDDVVHAVMTDHWIQGRPPSHDLLGERREIHETDETAYHGEVDAYYPASVDPLYLAVAQVKQKSNLARGIPRLAAAMAQQKAVSAPFYVELAEARRNAGDLRGALADYEEAARRDPQSAYFARRLGDALRESGDLARALEVLQRAVRLDADDARGWYLLGVGQAALQQRTDAVASLRRAVDLDPDLTDAYNTLGGLLAESGDAPGAETAFRGALRVQPDHPDAHANLALLEASRGSLREAAGHFAAALRARPDNDIARCNYAILLIRMQQTADAEEEIRVALKHNPRLPQAHDILGTLLREKGQIAAARSEFETALRVAPGDARARLNFGALLADQGDAKSAAIQFKQAAASQDAGIRQQAERFLRMLSAQ